MNVIYWFYNEENHSMYPANSYLHKNGFFKNRNTIDRREIFWNPLKYIKHLIRDWNSVWLYSAPPYESSVFPLAISCILKDKTIYFSSSVFWDEPSKRGLGVLSKLAWRYYLKNSEVVMTTEPAKNALNQKFDIESTVIPHACDTSVYKPDKTVRSRDNIVLFVGKLIEKKGITELLHIAKQNKEYEFWFVGKGPLKVDVLKHEKKTDNVKYFGFIDSNERLASIYSRASVLVLPSKSVEPTGFKDDIMSRIPPYRWQHIQWEELFGRVIIESLSCETPVIASAHSGPTSIINDQVGVTIEEKRIGELDIDKFETAIHQLLEDDEKRQHMSQAGREYIKSNYDVPVVAKKWLNIFDEV